MFSIFKKKKLSEDQASQLFVNSIVRLVDEGFDDVVEIIKNDPEFERTPVIDPASVDKFLLIVIAGNISLIGKYFNRNQDVLIIDKSIRKFASILGVEPNVLKETLNKYQSWMSQINQPSKNTIYAMSKGIFYKYELNQYQSEYFKNMNTPNPIFLKRLDEIVSQFIFDWNDLIENFRIIE